MSDDGREPESEYDGLLRAIARAPERAPTPAEATLAPDTVVAGKFRVVRTIGAGGMGKVYEVEHELTKHHRALKVLHPTATANVVERFVREASAAARIANPHIAETFDAGRLASGEPYLLMELLEGETLEARLARTGPVSPGELADLIHQACEGIQAAHDAGIVHRDLKPENLFVTVRDAQLFVKILDFGISKFDEGRTGAPGITKDGAMMGTPYYMSPEQVRGTSNIDARTDVYALGVILYECASGQRPYEAPYVEQLAVLIHEGKAMPLEQRMPSLPVPFCAIVHRAMANEPHLRFGSARELGEALAPFRSRTILTQAEARRASSTPPARVVVRPSNRPSRPADEGPQSAVVPSTQAALAATLATGPSSPPPRRSRALAPMAVVGLVVGIGGALVAARSLKGPAASEAAPSVEVRAPPTPVAEVPTPSVVLVAPPLMTATPESARADASAPIGSALAHPSARPAGSTVVPPSRADQKGLAGENPFR